MRNYIDFWERSVVLVQDPAFGDFSTVVSFCLPELAQVDAVLEACMRLNSTDYFGLPMIYNVVNPQVTWQEPRKFYVKLDSSDVVIRMLCGFLSDAINDDARLAGRTVVTTPNAIAEFDLDMATLKLQVVTDSPR